MMSTKVNRFACLIALTLLIASLTTSRQTALAAGEDAPVKTNSVRKNHHLPPHYRSIVNEKQREEIYKIQEQYEPRIKAIQDQLNALKKERDEKISAVLTAEQRKQVKEAAAWAKKKPKSAQSAESAKEVATPPPEESKRAK
jgi:hypothetical protein